MNETPRHRSGVVGAVVLIGIGAIFLLNNFGYLGWDSWQIIWRLWPLILVLWGLQVVFGKSRLANLAVGLVGLVIFGLLLLYILAVSSGPLQNWATNIIPGWETNLKPLHSPATQSKSETIKEADFKDVHSRQLKVELGVDRIIVNDDNSTNYLSYDAHFQGDAPSLTNRLVDNTLFMELKTLERRMMFGFWGERKMTATVGRPDLPTALAVSVGTGQADISLDQLLLSSLSVQVGTGSTDLTLTGSAVPSTATITSGTGSVRINLPSDTGVKVTYSVGLGLLKFGDGTLRGNGTTTSENYESAKQKIELVLSVGTGSISVNQ